MAKVAVVVEFPDIKGLCRRDEERVREYLNAKVSNGLAAWANSCTTLAFQQFSVEVGEMEYGHVQHSASGRNS